MKDTNTPTQSKSESTNVKSEQSLSEEKILSFWKNNKIYHKSVAKNEKGKPFYFMDGPPYASGDIHLGTALNKSLKDIAMRSRRLQGYDVFDRSGYDTHGVPIELKAEKELGITTKQEIENIGVDKFVSTCKKIATRYIDTMNNEFINLGVWMDFDDPYLTFSDEWIEAIWASFKEADNKGLLYLGKYPVHVCSRCGTAVAFNEIEYEKRTDRSIYVKFPLNEKNNTFLVIWTTTPWTLPANTGIMVNPEIIYQELELSNGEKLIIAKNRVMDLMTLAETGFTIVKEFKGKEMEGWTYSNPLKNHIAVNPKNSYRVVCSARYVTDEDGTGLVHCAPGHGKEDYDVGKQNNLEIISPVSIEGTFTEETGKYSTKKVLSSNSEIVNDLKADGFLVAEKSYNHDYPLCWRDKTPLIMISQPQWFLRISKIQEKLLEENENVNWLPSWVKSRMEAWLKGIGDWPVSRQRYWGTPLPIWYDEKTGEKVIVGSVKELEKLSGMKVKDLHKPGIDSIIINGKNGPLRRVPAVLDVWFDSGVASWAALGYPSKKDKFDKFWPADLNIEGKDQIRGWWNSQIILSEILFGKKPFNNIVMHGMILDLGKRKLSKSAGNGISPSELMNKYSRDHIRYYFAKVSKGEDFAFDEKELAEFQKITMMIKNINAFVGQLPKKGKENQFEDKWIKSKYYSLVEKVTKSYEEYKFFEVVALLEQFLIQDLSRTYIQMIRERAQETGEILREIRNGLVVLFAPIVPFFAETTWQYLKETKEVLEESVHLADWPKLNNKNIDAELEEQFELLSKILVMGNAERDRAKIGLRWPLASVKVNCDKAISKGIQQIILKQLNVKEIIVEKGKTLEVKLDLVQTPELEAEGYSRELARKIQAERKNAGYTKEDIINMIISTDEETEKMLLPYKTQLEERVNSKKITFDKIDINNNSPLDCSVKHRRIWVLFS